MENSPPPFENSPPQMSEFAKLDEIAATMFVKTFFFFFLEITLFWAEKSFECRISAKKSL